MVVTLAFIVFIMEMVEESDHTFNPQCCKNHSCLFRQRHRIRLVTIVC